MLTEQTLLNELDLELGLNPPPAFTRSANVGECCPRVGDKKYYRTKYECLDGYGNKHPSNYCLIKSYETNGALVKVCNINLVYPHAYEKWVHCGNSLNKTNEYIVVDLATGDTLYNWVYDKVNQTFCQISTPEDAAKDNENGICSYCKKTPSKYCDTLNCVRIDAPFEGDLK